MVGTSNESVPVAWALTCQVVYNGQSVFHEKPVFICFPQGVHLHWSTTLPITAAELTEDDNLEIVVGWGGPYVGHMWAICGP